MAKVERLSDRAEELLKEVNGDKIPRHIAIIMDGNGRWAKKRHLRRVSGHRKGSDAVRQAVRAAKRLDKVRFLTLYAFSIENWKRPPNEVSAIMTLLEDYLCKEEREMLDNDIRLRYIGRIEDLPESTRAELLRVAKSTEHCESMMLTLALSYSGRAEIVDAVRKVVAETIEGKDHSMIDEECFSSKLYTDFMPEPELLIRTSGEMRISNFMLWQIAYTELFIHPVLWPDFKDYHLIEAVIDYQKRERRFGGIEQVE